MRNACRVSALETIGCVECEYTKRQDTAKQRRFVVKRQTINLRYREKYPRES